MSCEVPRSHNSPSVGGANDYAIFGGCLRSELEFPELRAEAVTDPTWYLEIDSPVAPPLRANLLGVGLEPNCRVELYRQDDGFFLCHSCAGGYGISGDGRRIRWHRKPNAAIEVARADVFGRVLAVALHAMGYMTLHASAVALQEGAVAFLAP